MASTTSTSRHASRNNARSHTSALPSPITFQMIFLISAITSLILVAPLYIGGTTGPTGAQTVETGSQESACPVFGGGGTGSCILVGQTTSSATLPIPAQCMQVGGCELRLAHTGAGAFSWVGWWSMSSGMATAGSSGSYPVHLSLQPGDGSGTVTSPIPSSNYFGAYHFSRHFDNSGIYNGDLSNMLCRFQAVSTTKQITISSTGGHTCSLLVC